MGSRHWLLAEKRTFAAALGACAISTVDDVMVVGRSNTTVTPSA